MQNMIVSIMTMILLGGGLNIAPFEDWVLPYSTGSHEGIFMVAGEDAIYTEGVGPETVRLPRGDTFRILVNIDATNPGESLPCASESDGCRVIIMVVEPASSGKKVSDLWEFHQLFVGGERSTITVPGYIPREGDAGEVMILLKINRGIEIVYFLPLRVSVY